MGNLPAYRAYPPEYEKYMAAFAGQAEIIGWMLWDTVTFTSAAVNTLRFFNTVRATVNLGNLTLASQLAQNEAFLIRALRFKVLQVPRSVARVAAGTVQTGAISNIQLLQNTGTFRLTVGSKIYSEFPLWMIPAGGGPDPIMSADGDVADPGEIQDFANNGVPTVDNCLTLTKPIFLPPQMTFYVDVAWPAAITLDGGNTNLVVVLDGEIIRPVQ